MKIECVLRKTIQHMPDVFYFSLDQLETEIEKHVGIYLLNNGQELRSKEQHSCHDIFLETPDPPIC